MLVQSEATDLPKRLAHPEDKGLVAHPRLEIFVDRPASRLLGWPRLFGLRLADPSEFLVIRILRCHDIRFEVLKRRGSGSEQIIYRPDNSVNLS